MKLLDDALAKTLAARTKDEALDVISWLTDQIFRSRDLGVKQTLNVYRRDLQNAIRRGELK